MPQPGPLDPDPKTSPPCGKKTPGLRLSEENLPHTSKTLHQCIPSHRTRAEGPAEPALSVQLTLLPSWEQQCPTQTWMSLHVPPNSTTLAPRQTLSRDTLDSAPDGSRPGLNYADLFRKNASRRHGSGQSPRSSSLSKLDLSLRKPESKWHRSRKHEKKNGFSECREPKEPTHAETKSLSTSSRSSTETELHRLPAHEIEAPQPLPSEPPPPTIPTMAITSRTSPHSTPPTVDSAASFIHLLDTRSNTCCEKEDATRAHPIVPESGLQQDGSPKITGYRNWSHPSSIPRTPLQPDRSDHRSDPAPNHERVSPVEHAKASSITDSAPTPPPTKAWAVHRAGASVSIPGLRSRFSRLDLIRPRAQMGALVPFHQPTVPLRPWCLPLAMPTRNDMRSLHCKQSDVVEETISTDTPSNDPEGVESCSPLSAGESVSGSENECYDTPLTSPGTSPPKPRPDLRRLSSFGSGLLQFDGGSDRENEALSDSESLSDLVSARLKEVIARHSIEHAVADSDDDEPGPSAVVDIGEATENVDHPCADNTSEGPVDEADQAGGPSSDEVPGGADTPLAPASPAKRPSTFPFPFQSSARTADTSRVHLRRPSTLLSHCERNASARQRRLMAEGIQSPDRFIPSRAATPTKDALQLSRPRKESKSCRFPIRFPEPLSDPFAATSDRSLRMAEQYATIRYPPSMRRPAGMLASRVRDAEYPHARAASAGAVWTVGGSIVTEGVASVTNGRGGRVTSRTSAPHYTADFLRKTTPSDEEVTHGRRLAVALDVSPEARMMEQGSPPFRVNGAARVWRNGAWETENEATPTKPSKRKEKGIPTIPFRVLDAPALRDDYYCSLLAYSPTVDCLAVGLGPHIYLWSESRGKRALPDSLTVPAGTAHVTSISFSSVEGGCAILAIGRADGRITLWSPLDRDPRFDSAQPASVSCVAFRPKTVQRSSMRDPVAIVATEEILVGDEQGCIYYYAVEWPNQDQRDLFNWHGSMTLLARLSCHAQQICGIAWSPDGDFFATGGNDNQLFLFERRKILQPPPDPTLSSSSPIHVRNGSASSTSKASITGQGEVLTIPSGQQKHVFTLNAAVKAVAFAPWQPTLLAAGGGSNDRCVHFFHTLSGATLATIDCHAQVTSLIWSSAKKEIAATFGFAQPEHPYRVAVFAWPGCAMVVGIPWWGEERALFAVPYPKGPSCRYPQSQSQSQAQRRGERRGSGGDEKADSEGRPWYEKRTRREGCLVVATSDASIKFHEIWSEKSPRGKDTGANGVFAGSQILEGACSQAVEALGTIR